jgi:hypothetical protein
VSFGRSSTGIDGWSSGSPMWKMDTAKIAS